MIDLKNMSIPCARNRGLKNRRVYELSVCGGDVGENNKESHC